MRQTTDLRQNLFGEPCSRDRAAAWATTHGYQLVLRTRYCAHILAKHACPATTRYALCAHSVSVAFDHGRVWQRRDGSRFLLAHVYQPRAAALGCAAPHAAQRGLVVTIDDAADWYGCGTVPLRYDPARPAP